MEYLIDICKNCGIKTYIENKAKKLCKRCNFKRRHNGKDKYQVDKEKCKKKTIKIKNTGEKKLFLEIWEEREHICSNPNCKKFLGEEPLAQFFSHRKPKSTHPELRLDKNNVYLKCFECHFEEETGWTKS